jgi:hypothetical protein
MYEVTSGTDRGTKTMAIVRVREIGNVPYYVVRLDDLDHYCTRGLDWAAAVRTSTVEARMIPPPAPRLIPSGTDVRAN